MPAINKQETIDDLQNGFRIIQKTDGFRFGIDAVLLSDFAKCNVSRMLDLCTGTGIIPILLAAKTGIKQIDAIEIQPDIADMAKRSVHLNRLDDRINFECADLKNAPNIYGNGVFDAITVNPPYMKAGSGLQNPDNAKLISRHEVRCTLEDVISVSASLLIPHGKFFMVHRPQRLSDIICIMRKYRLEPKLMRFVAPQIGKEPNLILIQGVKDSAPEIKLLPELYVYDEHRSYTKEINEIYGR